MPDLNSPEAIVQRQLDAYNARDLDALLATYAPDAKQYELPATLLATGHAEMGPRLAVRFTEPNLYAHLIRRTVMGNVVIDHEDITRTFADGPGKVELIAIYEVVDGLIRSQTVKLGTPRLDAAAG